MTRGTLLKKFAMLAMGGIPLVTQASCDPYGGSFFRDDDEDGYYDSYYDPVVYVDDCYFDDCYYDDVVYVEEVYVGP